MLWTSVDERLPDRAGYYAITTLSDPLRAKVAYFNEVGGEFDYMPPREAIEWLIEPVLAATLAAISSALDKKASERIFARLTEIEEDIQERVESEVIDYLESGYDTGANRDVMTWCELPDAGISADDETGAEIVQLGAFEVADEIMPHLRAAIAKVVTSRSKDAA